MPDTDTQTTVHCASVLSSRRCEIPTLNALPHVQPQTRQLEALRDITETRTRTEVADWPLAVLEPKL